MIEINGKVYRNMPEQVEENMDDIDALLKQLPYNGPYATLDDIPADVIVDNGTYLIGTESYTIYKYNESTDEFISLGLFGAKGDKGETGAKGETGDRGEQGIKGATGTAAGFGTPVINVTTVTAVEPATGTVTASGDDTAKVFTFDFEIPRGLDGVPGPKGDKGDQGIQGIMGPTGPKGDKGDTGNTGAAAGFGDVETYTTTLDADEDAVVVISAEGPDTAKDFIFSFGIPRGTKGETGPQGPQGPQGIQGIQGEPGVNGKDGVDGINGTNGKDGEDGAAGGFGVPTATATGLAAGANPTAAVTASGPDTAKVFAFTFGIPKGDKGDTGAPNTIVIGANTYSGTTITLPTTTLQFTSFSGATTTSYIVLG